MMINVTRGIILKGRKEIDDVDLEDRIQGVILFDGMRERYR